MTTDVANGYIRFKNEDLSFLSSLSFSEHEDDDIGIVQLSEETQLVFEGTTEDDFFDMLVSASAAVGSHVFLLGSKSNLLSNVGEITQLNHPSILIASRKTVNISEIFHHRNSYQTVETVETIYQQYPESIEITWASHLPFPQPGDSGGVYFVYSDDGKLFPLGMHVGSRENKSYAIPMDKIFTKVKDEFEVMFI